MGEPELFLDGTFLPVREARLNIRIAAFHYGLGVFDAIYAPWSDAAGRHLPFRMADHYRRLHASARFLQMTLPYSVDELCGITVDLLARNRGGQDLYVRATAFNSSEKYGFRLQEAQVSLCIACDPFHLGYSSDGIHCCVSTWRRPSENSLPARIKFTGSYINNALARAEAHANGFDEAILLNSRGFVAEGAGENIFLVRQGRLITPGASESILLGITRDTIFDLATQAGVAVAEGPIDRADLYTCDECFLCGTMCGVTPVLSVDRHRVRDSYSPSLTRRLQAAYEAATHERSVPQ